MSQSTLDDDELFGEAASEVRADVEESLAAGWAALPDADAVWEVEADNALGALNALRSALDAEAAHEHLRDAKKWYALGERADAFEDDDDLADDLDALEETLGDVADAREQVGDLAATLPELRSALEAHAGGDGGDGEGSESEA